MNPPPSSADRFERWVIVILGSVGGLVCGMYLALVFAEVLYRPLLGADAAAAVAGGQPSTALLVSFALMFLLPACGIVAFILVLKARVRASHAFAVRAVEEGKYAPLRSPALPLTAAAWGALLVGCGLGLGPGALFSVVEGTDLGVDLSDPLPGVFGAVSVAIVILLSSWRMRRREEVNYLLKVGLLVPAVRPGTPVHGFAALKEGVHAWTVAALITGSFVLLGWAQAWVDGVDLTWESQLTGLAINLFAYPAAIAIALFIILFLSPFQFAVKEALRSPITKIALALLVVGGIASLVTDFWLVTVALGLGTIVTGVTMLRLMDTGPQPWLGIIFLVTAYGVGLTYDPEADRGTLGVIIPNGVFEWIAAIVGVCLIVYDVRTHWFVIYGVRHAEKPDPAVAGPD